ncbi:probable LRR receptor-like serine/threonine-protein kinase At2g16250 [Dioscorea cayenensis subsp. rotundata]|uniref:Probable LRR receptor-like serine/threonine-protein kinase At2g16250 n=1 Tax=Dioscorea cayennensis subsp. rotundata TaxID=55577 RepID=A0AB40AY44_DIOCR|nr:probable LRR receptor-like serine/threonine-protein kinase At2g16250 [Dioscorea cayenensis subsp. rotundata]
MLFTLLWVTGAGDRNLTSRTDLATLFSPRTSLGLRVRDWSCCSDPCSTWVGVSCYGGCVVSVNVSGLRRTKLGRHNPRFAVDKLRNFIGDIPSSPSQHSNLQVSLRYLTS